MSAQQEQRSATFRGQLARFFTHPATIVALIVILIVGMLVVRVLMVGSSRLERAVARIKATGEPLTFQELEALRPAVPDNQNMAPLISRHGTDIKNFRKSRMAGPLG